MKQKFLILVLVKVSFISLLCLELFVNCSENIIKDYEDMLYFLEALGIAFHFLVPVSLFVFWYAIIHINFRL